MYVFIVHVDVSIVAIFIVHFYSIRKYVYDVCIWYIDYMILKMGSIHIYMVVFVMQTRLFDHITVKK